MSDWLAVDRLVYLLLTSVAAALTSWQIVELWRARASTSWPTVGGMVLDAEVVATPSDRPHHPDYEAAVRYRYVVEGRTYEATRVYFGPMELNPADAKSYVKRYSPGTAVTVHYNPAHPSQAVLQAGASAANYVAVGVSLAFLTAALVWL
jgi:hypothetical protein